MGSHFFIIYTYLAALCLGVIKPSTSSALCLKYFLRL
jgi:hypothetical protein